MDGRVESTVVIHKMSSTLFIFCLFFRILNSECSPTNQMTVELVKPLNHYSDNILNFLIPNMLVKKLRTYFLASLYRNH